MKPADSDVVRLLPSLLRYALSLTRDEVAAEDLVHDTLILALAENSSYRAGAPLRQWLFAILHNRFISDIRREQTRERHAATLSDLSGSVAPPEQEVAVALTQTQAGLDALPAEQREALHLVVIEGLSYAQAAEAIGVPIGTLMSRIARARARLRDPHGTKTADDAVTPLRLVKR